jgi:hypothetical protein
MAGSWPPKGFSRDSSIQSITRSPTQPGSRGAKLRAFVTKKRWFDVLRRAFEAIGVEFIDENGGGPGMRLRKPPQGKQRK